MWCKGNRLHPYDACKPEMGASPYWKPQKRVWQLTNLGHVRCCWRQHIVDEEEDSLLRAQFHVFPNLVHKLAHRNIRRNQVPDGDKLQNWAYAEQPKVQYFFLSMSGASLFGAFSTMTGIRSGYLSRMRWATSCRLAASRLMTWEKAALHTAEKALTQRMLLLEGWHGGSGWETEYDVHRIEKRYA